MRAAVAMIMIAALAGCAAPEPTDGATVETNDPVRSAPGSTSPASITPTTLPPPSAPPSTATGFTLRTATADGAPAFLASDGSKNPTLVVPAGAEITIELIRGGELHAFTVNGRGVIGAGTDDTRATFTAPESGTVEYDCPIHPTTMRGTIQVA